MSIFVSLLLFLVTSVIFVVVENKAFKIGLLSHLAHWAFSMCLLRSYWRPLLMMWSQASAGHLRGWRADKWTLFLWFLRSITSRPHSSHTFLFLRTCRVWACHDKGLGTNVFLIRAFGLSEELSTEVGFAFSNNGFKSQDLRFGMKKITCSFL